MKYSPSSSEFILISYILCIYIYTLSTAIEKSYTHLSEWYIVFWAKAQIESTASLYARKERKNWASMEVVRRRRSYIGSSYILYSMKQYNKFTFRALKRRFIRGMCERLQPAEDVRKTKQPPPPLYFRYLLELVLHDVIGANHSSQAHLSPRPLASFFFLLRCGEDIETNSLFLLAPIYTRTYTCTHTYSHTKKKKKRRV